MNTLILSSGATFGPFRSVVTKTDRLVCDGVEYPLGVIGAYEISSSAPPAPAVLPAVPETVPMLNARRALYQAGKLAAVEAIIAALEGEEGDLARITWGAALSVQRHDPLTLRLMAALPLTDAEADALFIAAAAFQ
ncbi:hypothetical protein [Rugamonas rubra]|uniref:Uncharacterized protein n=1 Tax=Rugamonas rubra TaxID=758825 RepID=A0A1I4SG48_9BURK|nr:hypothetical protein [Rugamonas rubra]SFM63455.1 hypothetical protein SAMN02982985_04758 [Rugamonas rubra]